MKLLSAILGSSHADDMKEQYAILLKASSVERQVCQLSEEFAEFTKEVMSRMRNRKSTNEDLVEELADCLIMLDQMIYIFGVTDKELCMALNTKMKKFVYETVPKAVHGTLLMSTVDDDANADNNSAS
jgi:NTP pyrophosphatase (non-canonical NTP hydrolase)